MGQQGQAGSVLGRGTVWGHRDSLWFIIYGFFPIRDRWTQLHKVCSCDSRPG